ncbi:MAG: tetratricopeptide repeat protein [Chloroflexi bacterium]|nr:tetratricopeptide repeat protein [Chloroflexota bacterium]
MLGPPQIERDGQPVTPDRHKSVALLAYLAVSRHRHSRDELATLFWPDFNQTSARASLRRTLAALKKDIGDAWLEVDRDLIGLLPDTDLRVDVDDFRRYLAECKTHGHAPTAVCQACLSPLSEAVNLARGDFMAGFSLSDSPAFEDWQVFQAEDLRRVLSSALARLADAHSTQREFEAAIAHARRRLTLDVLDEEAHRVLMQLYAWNGQVTHAVGQYRACREFLDKELGVPPDEATTRLYEDIKSNRLPPVPDRYLPVPLAGSVSGRHNLPVQLTPFIGREDELAQIEQLLAPPTGRLISLVGPGGIGKTRLAVQSAAQHLATFRHGVYFVALAPLSSPEYLVAALADALQFSFYGAIEPKTQLISFLREKELLLVLDNFEHLIADVPLLAEILQNAPLVKMIVTSRERLNLRGEWLLEVGGLSYPTRNRVDEGRHYSALELFISCARRRDSTFTYSAADLPYITRICQLVGGMPLAIELAASWVRVLPLKDIVREVRIDTGILMTSEHNVPARHRSLLTVFDHSWNLLDEAEQAALLGLAVFRGSFQREIAAQVAGASTELLSSLVDKSLLRRTAAGRFELHQLLRQYLAKKLTEQPALEQAALENFCRHYADFLHQREKYLRAGRQKEIMAEIGEEIDNVRAAWQWSIDRANWDLVARGSEALFFFYDLRSLVQEGVELFAAAAARLTESAQAGQAIDHRLLGCLLARQARLLHRQGRLDQARALYQQSLDLHTRLGARRDSAFARTYLGDLNWMTGDYDTAYQLLRDSVEICTLNGDGYLLGRTLNSLGIVASIRGDYTAAGELYRNSLAIQREIGDRIGQSLVLNNLGGIAFLRREYERAKFLYEESLTIQTEIDDRRGEAMVLTNLADVALASGNKLDAKWFLQWSLTIRKETGDLVGSVYTLNSLGETTSALCQPAEAMTYYLEALAAARETQAAPLTLSVLVSIAAFWQRQGQAEQALELLAFVLNNPVTEQEYKDRASQLLAQIEPELDPQIVAAAHERGLARRLEEVCEEIWIREKRSPRSMLDKS